VDDLQATATTLGVQGIERSRVMSSSQTTGEARPDVRQIGYFPYQNGDFARSSAILRSGGVHRNSSGLSTTPNAGTLHSSRGRSGESRFVGSKQIFKKELKG